MAVIFPTSHATKVHLRSCTAILSTVRSCGEYNAVVRRHNFRRLKQQEYKILKSTTECHNAQSIRGTRKCVELTFKKLTMTFNQRQTAREYMYLFTLMYNLFFASLMTLTLIR